MERDDRKACIATLLRGIDAGMTHLDTAELYGSGRVEQTVVREVIEERRDDVFLVSKVMPSNASYDGTIRACERSLERLGTDRLDGYLLHWEGNHPLAETLRAFETLEKDGKILSFGLSNFDEVGCAEAVGLVGEGRVACNQVLYHLQERAIEHACAPYCAEHDITVVAYSPLGAGSFPADDERLRDVAAAHDATPYQIALAFLLRLDGALMIPKAATLQHALDNAKAAEIELSDDEAAQLDAAFPRGPRRPGVPTL
jgi:diketogulonate reductase-like aldo/keto reductase